MTSLTFRTLTSPHLHRTHLAHLLIHTISAWRAINAWKKGWGGVLRCEDKALHRSATSLATSNLSCGYPSCSGSRAQGSSLLGGMNPESWTPDNPRPKA